MNTGGRDDLLLEVSGLKTWFETEAGTVRSVDGVDLALSRGETLALVGESGSGKSVTSLSIMRLVPEPAGRIVAGAIRLRCKDGATRDLAALDEDALRRVRGNDVAMIFQEPMTSLNPVQPVGEQIAEALRLHEGLGRRAALDRARALLETVEVPDAARRLGQYPHQLSGGMRQRVMIAMALACRPALLIADEPTTALDVTIQAQVLDLMRRLQRELGMAILFITHNLGVVAEMARRVAVMYGGIVVEQAPVAAIFSNPLHPYTRGLLKSVPRIGATDEADDAPARRLEAIPGSVPSPLDLPAGCPFANRCAWRVDACDAGVPPVERAGDGHLTRCLRWREIAA